MYAVLEAREKVKGTWQCLSDHIGVHYVVISLQKLSEIQSFDEAALSILSSLSPTPRGLSLTSSYPCGRRMARTAW